MKPTLILPAFLLTLLSLNISGQNAPAGINYQAIARGTNGKELPETQIGVEFILLDGTIEQYREQHTVTTNKFGLFSLVVGEGTPQGSTTIDQVNWSGGNIYFIVGIDPEGGSSYTYLDTVKFQSVPYALFAPGAWEGSAGSVYPVNLTDNIGIGTSSPQYKLDVTGEINTSGGILINGTAPSGEFLKGNGTVFTSGPILSSDLPPGPASWTKSGNSLYSGLTDNVGIGTFAPVYKVDISGVLRSSGGFLDGTGTPPPGHVLRSNGTTFVSSAIQPGDLPASATAWTVNGTNLHLSTGLSNVGIGTSSPSSPLTINATVATPGFGSEFFLTSTSSTGSSAAVRGSATENGGGTVFGGYFAGIDQVGGLAGGLLAQASGSGAGTKRAIEATATGSGNKTSLFANATGPGINYGIYASATGGTTNYAAFFPDGDSFFANRVGIGTQSPTGKFSVFGPVGTYYGHNNAMSNFVSGTGGSSMVLFVLATSTGDTSAYRYGFGKIGGYQPVPANSGGYNDFGGWFHAYDSGTWGLIASNSAGQTTTPELSTNYAAFANNFYAGYFNGNVSVVGTLSKSGGTFKIDHPLDPANKYLIHSFVESPDMLNIYNGNITTGQDGQAIVQLPAYFEAENIEFKYQLTVIGQFAQAIVLEEISNNSFVIKTDKPFVKVSWQVTGVRNDKWAQQNRFAVEVDKKGYERGRYLHPELFNAPPSQAITPGNPDTPIRRQ